MSSTLQTQLMQTTQPNLVHKVTWDLVLHDREDDEMVNRVRVGFEVIKGGEGQTAGGWMKKQGRMNGRIAKCS